MSLPTVSTSSITGLKKIADPGKAVFIATTSNGEKFVIKREQSTGTNEQVASHRWASKLMRKAMNNDSVLKIKALTGIEKTALVNVVILHRPNNLTDTLYKDIINPANSDFLWVKMPLNEFFGKDFELWYSKIDDNSKPLPKDVLDQKAQELQQTKLYLFEAMDHHSFWKALGKILAIDMFNSNFDRFEPGGILSNGGNVVLNLNSDRPMPIDAWNAAQSNNVTADYTKSINNPLANTTEIKEGLDILKNSKGEARTFAETVITEMLTKVGKADDQEMVRKFIKTYKDDLLKGIGEGKDSLKQVLRQKAAQYGGANKAVTQIGSRLPSAMASKLPGFKHAVNQSKTASATQTPGGRFMPIGLVERAEYLGWL